MAKSGEIASQKRLAMTSPLTDFANPGSASEAQPAPEAQRMGQSAFNLSLRGLTRTEGALCLRSKVCSFR